MKPRVPRTNYLRKYDLQRREYTQVSAANSKGEVIEMLPHISE